jgi:hypothetical protein
VREKIEYRFRVSSTAIFTLYSYSKALEYRFRVPTAVVLPSITEAEATRPRTRPTRQGCPRTSVGTSVPFDFYSNLYLSIGAEEIETRRRPDADARRNRDALVLVAGCRCPAQQGRPDPGGYIL